MSKELKEKVRYRLKEHSHIFTNEKIDEQELRFTVARIVEELRIRSACSWTKTAVKNN